MAEYALVKKALKGFLPDCTDSLARILAVALKTGQISYEEIEDLIGAEDEVEEVLLMGYSWRLLLPRRSLKTMEWEDRLLIPMPGEIYEIPSVIRELVREASRSGRWEPHRAIAALFKQIEGLEGDRMPDLVELLAQYAKGAHVTAIQIKRACRALDMEDKVDSIIAYLKAGGIVSPALGYLPKAGQRRTPVYELNPSVLPGYHRSG